MTIEEVRARRDSLVVSTTIRLNSLLAQDAKAELSSMLSPRGRMVTLSLNNRIAVCDRADNIRALDLLLLRIDPPGRNAAARLKTYTFQYAKASEAANVARELLGLEVEENQSGAATLGGLATQFVTRKNAKRVGKMFMPGMMDMMGGGPPGGGEGSEHDPKVRLTVDTERNLLFVHGPYEKLGYLDTLLKAIDAPPAPNAPENVQIDLRVFAVTTGEGEAVAQKLKAAATRIPGMLIFGSKDKVIAKGPKNKLLEVQALFEQLNPAAMQFAAFPTGTASAQGVARQLAKLFAADAEATRPLLAASAADDQLVVRGTAGQVARIAGMMKSYDDVPRERTAARPAGKTPAAKSSAK